MDLFRSQFTDSGDAILTASPQKFLQCRNLALFGCHHNLPTNLVGDFVLLAEPNQSCNSLNA